MRSQVLRIYIALMKYARWERKLCRCPRCLADEEIFRDRFKLGVLVAFSTLMIAASLAVLFA